ncbi:MAG: peptidoglycan glycosyltransferase, partial [Pseudothermotoga sp.]
MRNSFLELRAKLIIRIAGVVAAVMILSFCFRGTSMHVAPTWNLRIPAMRGKILDTNGRFCAVDEIYYVAYLDVRFLRSRYSDRLSPQLTLLLRNFNLSLTAEEVLRG